ncbi:unnamed protein product [Prorocentrum cordatum]|uniref:Uncharacterized protein n=1 Tax=Prorocentrum cordatum TaxID=2364126 RepID=A0ABN9WZB5_9DINO|nr:unnamed protein product [Polarella glacialis]
MPRRQQGIPTWPCPCSSCYRRATWMYLGPGRPGQLLSMQGAGRALPTTGATAVCFMLAHLDELASRGKIGDANVSIPLYSGWVPRLGPATARPRGVAGDGPLWGIE